MKTVSQLDALGYFVGPTIADESPLEDGVYLIPGGAVDVPPPALADGQRALFSAGSWLFEAIPQPPPPAPPETADPLLPVIPTIVTMRQARLALLQAGKLSAVQVAIDALPSPQKEAALIEWDYSSEVHRDKPFVQMLGAVIGLTSAQLDQLFIDASKL